MTALHRSRSIRLLSCAALAVGLLVARGIPAHAGPAGVTDELTLKAVLLYKFAQFATWPERASEGAEDAFTIGVVGDDPFGDVLDNAVRGRRINGRPVTVQRYASARSLGNCQLLYVAPSERKRIPAIISALGNSPTLTVSDVSAFLHEGGAICMSVLDGRLAFEVCAPAAEANGVRVSSKLLQIAARVWKSAP